MFSFQDRVKGQIFLFFFFPGKERLKKYILEKLNRIIQFDS